MTLANWSICPCGVTFEREGRGVGRKGYCSPECKEFYSKKRAAVYTKEIRSGVRKTRQKYNRKAKVVPKEDGKYPICNTCKKPILDGNRFNHAECLKRRTDDYFEAFDVIF